MSLLQKHSDELRDMWQSRVLRAAKGKLRKVVIVALAKEYPDALVTLMKVTFPGFVDFSRPFFCSYAHVDLGGRIICDIIDQQGQKQTATVYDTEDQFITEMRRLADELKLVDKERIEMFSVLQKWVASDRRVGVFGQKLAS